MNIILIVLTFSIVLFIYLHIVYHLKTSDDLEVYELALLSKERLEEICDFRQPLTFNLNIENFDPLCKSNIASTYGSFDIRLRDISANNTHSELFLPVIFKKGIEVIQEDTNNRFVIEHNQDFLQETSLIKILKANDAFLRPAMLMYSYYDYIMGSMGAHTPFRYEVNYRHFLVVLSGKVSIKLAPPKSYKYLYPETDYDNFEFRSPINPWSVQEEYSLDFDKIKCMDVVLEKSKLLFIPANWWYSLKFDEKDTVVLSFRYRTYMNTVAILPQLFVSFLQKQNIKHEFIQKITRF